MTDLTGKTNEELEQIRDGFLADLDRLTGGHGKEAYWKANSARHAWQELERRIGTDAARPFIVAKGFDMAELVALQRCCPNLLQE